MYYMLNNFVFIRNINGYLKLWNKLNNENLIGDISSFLFLKHLNYEPLPIETLVTRISAEFEPSVEYQVIYNDAIFLFDNLVLAGCISKGSNESDCKNNSIRYSKSKTNSINPKPFCSFQESKVQTFGIEYDKKPAIQGILIEITEKCNENCIHCYIPKDSKNSLMKDTDFYRIVDECSELGTIVEVKISGGECMTHPSFKKYISYVKEKGFSLTVMTNLTLLDDEIIKILTEGTLSKVQVSLFSLDSQVHDAITSIPGSLRKVLLNLEKLYESNIPVCIATQVMEANRNSIENLLIYTKKHNFELNLDWTISAKENGDNSNLIYRVNDISYYKEICETRILHENNFKESYLKAVSLPLRTYDSAICSAGMNLLHVSADLLVHPCAGWSLELGNLRNHSLSEIWNTSDKLKEIRNITLRNFPNCCKCENRNICTICMAQAYSESRKESLFRVPEYICRMFQEIRTSIISFDSNN